MSSDTAKLFTIDEEMSCFFPVGSTMLFDDETNRDEYYTLMSSGLSGTDYANYTYEKGSVTYQGVPLSYVKRTK